MSEWLMDQQRKRPTLFMDIYLFVLAPFFILVKILDKDWLAIIMLLAVCVFLYSMRSILVYFNAAYTRRLTRDFYHYMKERQGDDADHMFDEWWENYRERQ